MIGHRVKARSPSAGEVVETGANGRTRVDATLSVASASLEATSSEVELARDPFGFHSW